MTIVGSVIVAEPDYVLTKKSATVDDVADLLSESLAGAYIFEDAAIELVVSEAHLDAKGTVNLILSNGQGFRVTVEQDDFERPGT